MKKLLFIIIPFYFVVGCFIGMAEDNAVGPVELQLQAHFEPPAVVLTANIPLDSAALLRHHLATEPDLPLLIREDGDSIRITPREDWPNDTFIILTILPFALDNANMKEPFQFSFRTPPPPAFNLVAVGDVMLDYLTGDRLRDYDPGYPFSRIEADLKRGDLVFANLESPISARGAPVQKMYTFRAYPFAAEALTHGGINLVSLANNHILDYGVEALLDTLEILDNHAIAYTGAGLNETATRRGARLEINGIKVAVLAYAGSFYHIYPAWQAGPEKPGLLFYYGYEDAFIEDIREARVQADVVIVSMHWGDEYTYRVNREQQNMGRLAVDSGADLVLGHHSHTPQGIEIYRGKVIVYSMGNFLFYPFTTYPFCNESYILKARVSLDGVESLRLLPVILGDSQPDVPSGDELRRLQDLLCSLLDQFSTKWEIDGAEIVIPVNNSRD